VQRTSILLACAIFAVCGGTVSATTDKGRTHLTQQPIRTKSVLVSKSGPGSLQGTPLTAKAARDMQKRRMMVAGTRASKGGDVARVDAIRPSSDQRESIVIPRTQLTLPAQKVSTVGVKNVQ
jgi:hypothetical protein